MEHKQVPCVWRMSYSQQASIVWSGHWCTLLQCIFSDPIIYPVPSHDLHFQRVRTIAPTARYSDDPLFRQPITPTAHFFRQCKIELNPQIHGLTRCIQQDGPSVRLILTDHGLDRMFWKGR